MRKERGFTLFQLVLFIVVGVIAVLFVVFPLLGHITSSTKRSFISSAKFYVDEARSFLTLSKNFPVDQNETYTIQISELDIDNDKKQSVYGNPWINEKSYIVVTNIGTMENPKYSYAVALEDEEGNCVDLKDVNQLLKSDIRTGTCNIRSIGSLASKRIENLSETNTSELKIDDYGNIRYYGKDPNNYIQFNGELWRVLGVFAVDGEMRVKIIRNESIGELSFDTSSSDVNHGSGVNDWANSDLMKVLNPGYEMESVGGSLYWNRQKGTCFNGPNGSSEVCDFSNTGLSQEAKTFIEKGTFHIGKLDPNTGSAKERFASEGHTPETSTASWRGYVGLMKPSDYGYAMGRDECVQNLKGSIESCQAYNYLWLSNLNQSNEWMMITSLLDISSVFQRVSLENGTVTELAFASKASSVRPVVYLKSSVRIMSGDGTIDGPFQIDIIQ